MSYINLAITAFRPLAAPVLAAIAISVIGGALYSNGVNDTLAKSRETALLSEIEQLKTSAAKIASAHLLAERRVAEIHETSLADQKRIEDYEAEISRLSEVKTASKENVPTVRGCSLTERDINRLQQIGRNRSKAAPIATNPFRIN